MRIGLVSSQRRTAWVVASLVLLTVPRTSACSFAVGYFHQVTALRGQVVGTSVRLPRWLRQFFARKHTKLELYEYRWPRVPSDLELVKTVETNSDGRFDFGPLKAGHYTLVIEGDQFDVEVRDLPRLTESVTIDVSPIFPDCTGGHEFILKEK